MNILDFLKQKLKQEKKLYKFFLNQKGIRLTFSNVQYFWINFNKYKIGWEFKKINLFLLTQKVEDSQEAFILRQFLNGDFPKAKYVSEFKDLENCIQIVFRQRYLYQSSRTI